jgi:hypothetical protein
MFEPQIGSAVRRLPAVQVTRPAVPIGVGDLDRVVARAREGVRQANVDIWVRRARRDDVTGLILDRHLST